MEASSIKEHKESVIEKGKYKLLPLAVFYGANSGGKSNLIQAIATMRGIVRRSVQLNEGDNLPYDPFALDRYSDVSPDGVLRIAAIQHSHDNWDGGDEYENAVPAGGYTYELAIPQEAVFLVCVPVDGNIPLGPVLLEQIALYDAQERNITDRFPLSGGWIQ